MTKICIIDDHRIVRQGLKELLEKLGNFKVISEFENGEDFLAALPLENPADIYILDYSMATLNGVDVLKKIEEKGYEFNVLLLSQHFDNNIINEAYKHGANGFLHKNCSAQDLKTTLENIIQTGYINPSNEIFTTREKEIINLLLKGESSDSIAQELFISIHTVNTHRKNILHKTNTTNTVEFAMKVINEGLI